MTKQDRVERSGANKVLLACAGIVFAVLAIQYLPVPNSSRLLRSLVDLGHAPVFALIAYGALRLAKLYRGRVSEAPQRAEYALAFGVVIMLAFLSEFLQTMDPERSVSLSDIGRNIGGGMLLLVAVHEWSVARGSGFDAWRIVRLCASAIVVGLLLVPLAITLGAYANRASKWPVVLSVDSLLDEVLSHPYNAMITYRRSGDFGSEQSGIHIKTINDQESGVTFSEVATPWHGYRELCVDMSNLDSTEAILTLRLGEHNSIFRSRNTVSKHLRLPAGSRHSACQLIEAVTADSAVSSDRGYRSLSLTVPPETASLEFVLHRIWLRQAPDSH